MTNVSCRENKLTTGHLHFERWNIAEGKGIARRKRDRIGKTYLSNRSITNDKDLEQVIIRKCLGWRSCRWRWHLAIVYRDNYYPRSDISLNVVQIVQEDDVALPGGRVCVLSFRLPIKAKKRAVEALSSNLRTKLVVRS